MVWGVAKARASWRSPWKLHRGAIGRQQRNPPSGAEGVFCSKCAALIGLHALPCCQDDKECEQHECDLRKLRMQNKDMEVFKLQFGATSRLFNEDSDHMWESPFSSFFDSATNCELCPVILGTLIEFAGLGLVSAYKKLDLKAQYWMSQGKLAIRFPHALDQYEFDIYYDRNGKNGSSTNSGVNLGASKTTIPRVIPMGLGSNFKSVPPWTGSKETCEAVENWIRALSQGLSTFSLNHEKAIEDSQTHAMRMQTADTELPTRIMYIGTKPEHIRLVEANGSCGNYACLSYCWGDARLKCTTTQANLMTNQLYIEWTTLPKTFQHVIELLWYLKFEYLWIDCICIVQDDQDDWVRESARMAQIYGNAAFTISAAWGRSPETGLFSRSVNPLKFTSTYHDGSEGQMFIRPSLHQGSTWAVTPDEAAGSKPVISRGWIYQERILSYATVYFFENEVMFETEHDFTCQCTTVSGSSNPIGSETKTRLLVHLREEPSEAWLRIVVNYSKMKLSFPHKDRLQAIRGVADRVQIFRPNDQYICGLWRSTWYRDILWTSAPPRAARLPRSTAPTWSWASVDGAVEFDVRHGVNLRCDEPEALLLDAFTKQYEDECGNKHVRHVLEVEGFVADAEFFAMVDHLSTRFDETLNRLHRGDDNVDLAFLSILDSGTVLVFREDCMYKDKDTRIHVGDQVALLAIQKHWESGDDPHTLRRQCLVLRKIGNTSEDPETYERIGRVMLSLDYQEGEEEERFKTLKDHSRKDDSSFDKKRLYLV